VLPQGDAGPFDRALWFDRLAAMHWAGTARCDAEGKAGGSNVCLPLVAPHPGTRIALANWYSFVFRPQFTGTADSAAKALALTDLFRNLRHSAAHIDLFPVPEIDGSHLLVQNALIAAGWWVVARPEGHSHWLDLTGLDHDSWWADRPGALRSTVARKSKKGIVDLRIVTTFDPDIWAAYERIYAASWKPGEGNPALLRTFAEDEGRAGRTRLGLATIDGVPVAAQYWTVENGCAFIHKLAHVEDSVKASPGTLLTAALFRYVIDVDRVGRVDFGTGNDPYKRDWMNRHNRLWRIRAFNPSRPTAWPAAVTAMLRNWRHREES
jgi:Acetyltransferase (GNAT) domain